MSLASIRAENRPVCTAMQVYSKKTLRDSLHREPSDDEVLAEIETTEDKARTAITNALEDRRADIAAIYADAASLAEQGKTDEAAPHLADARKLRESVIHTWHQQNGIADGKGDGPDPTLSPEEIVAADRDLLGEYLNGGVDNSP
jgi:predicted phage gp36 major capsid-like protein